MAREEDPLSLPGTSERPHPDPLLRVLVDVATAIVERKRRERADDVEVDE